MGARVAAAGLVAGAGDGVVGPTLPVGFAIAVDVAVLDGDATTAGMGFRALLYTAATTTISATTTKNRATAVIVPVRE